MSVEPGSDGSVGPAAGVGEAAESRQVSITVNGIRIQVTERVLVREVVKKASEAGAISGFVEEYVIERIDTIGEYGLEVTIEVQESDEFMAIPIGKTPLASGLPSILGR